MCKIRKKVKISQREKKGEIQTSKNRITRTYVDEKKKTKLRKTGLKAYSKRKRKNETQNNKKKGERQNAST